MSSGAVKRRVIGLDDRRTRLQNDVTNDVRINSQCNVCTYINEPSRTECDMCGHMLPVEPIRKQKTLLRGSINLKRKLDGKKSVLARTLRQKEDADAIQRWNHIIGFCKEHKLSFVDDSFPPHWRSLYPNQDCRLAALEVKWMRSEQIASENRQLSWSVFRDPVPDDIVQGLLGDCWLLSALTVLAERPELLKRIIPTQEFSHEGIYQVRLCKDGRWQMVLLDDYFPCNTAGQIMFSKSKRRQLWVPLIEKAMAKLHGSYMAVEAGRVVEGLSILTGEPCETIALQDNIHRHVDKDLVWKLIISGKDAKFLMGASCGQVIEDPEAYKAVGLVPDHAYALLDVREVQGHRLVKLRNPWGHYSWTGDWSNHSDKWREIPQKLKKEMIPNVDSPGTFWIAFEDIFKYFSNIEVCKVRPDWREARLKGKFPSNSLDPLKLATVTVTETTDFEIGLYQEGERGVKDQYMLDMCILVFKAPTSGDSVVGTLVERSRRELNSFVGCNVMLGPGTYVIVAVSFKQWSRPKSSNDYLLSLHTSKDIEVEDPVRTYKHAFADIICSLAVKEGKKQAMTRDVYMYTVNSEWIGIVYVLENHWSNQNFLIKMDYEDSKNVVTTRGSLLTMDSIPPKHRQVLMIMTIDDRITMATYAVKSQGTQRPFNGLDPWGHKGNHHPDIDSTLAGIHLPVPL